MNRIGNILSDEEVIGERGLRPQTVVEADYCLWANGSGWKVVQTIRGILVPAVERTPYPGQDPEDDNAYQGQQARIMPDNPYPEGRPHASLHPITLNLDPHDVEVVREANPALVTACWVLRQVSASSRDV